MRKVAVVVAVLAAGLLAQAAAVEATTFIVNVGGFSFSPANQTIAVGDKIRWVWVSGSHTTTSGTGPTDPNAGLLWDTPLNSLNPSFERTFLIPGTFPYFCRPHFDFGMVGTITVTGSPNQAPVSRDSVLTPTEDIGLPGQLQAYDPDAGPSALTYSITSGPFNGAISGFNAGTGAFTYTPNLNYAGADSLKFRVFDGVDNSNTGTERITVAAVNDPPVASDVPVSTTVNTPLAIGPMPVTDVDNVSWTISHLAGPFHGVVTDFDPADGSFTYTPDLDFVDLDSVTYQAFDGQDNSSPAKVRLTVLEACDCGATASLKLWADCNADGAVNPVDVVRIVNYVYKSQLTQLVAPTGVVYPNIPPPGPNPNPTCPRKLGDANWDDAVNPVDVVRYVNFVYKSQTTQICNNPCMSGVCN